MKKKSIDFVQHLWGSIRGDIKDNTKMVETAMKAKTEYPSHCIRSFFKVVLCSALIISTAATQTRILHRYKIWQRSNSKRCQWRELNIPLVAIESSVIPSLCHLKAKRRKIKHFLFLLLRVCRLIHATTIVISCWKYTQLCESMKLLFLLNSKENNPYTALRIKIEERNDKLKNLILKCRIESILLIATNHMLKMKQRERRKKEKRNIWVASDLHATIDSALNRL